MKSWGCEGIPPLILNLGTKCKQVISPAGWTIITNLDTVIRNFVSVGTDAQWWGSVTVVAKFPGSMIKMCGIRVTCGESKCSYSRVWDDWYDNCILLGCQSVNDDSTRHFRGGDHVTDQEATLKALRIHRILKKSQRKKRRNKGKNYQKETRT